MMKKTVLISLMALNAIVGCSLKSTRISMPELSVFDNNGWVAEYEAAEKKVRKTGYPLLIYFQTGDEKIDRRYRRAIDNGNSSILSSQFVRCQLIDSYEPDRRYVQQFGVQRSPALIMVHTDGTFHSEVGLLNDEQIGTFIANATPPGAIPQFNSHIPRKPEYVWHESLDTASAQAQQLDRPLFILYERTFSDDFSKMNELIARHEVYQRLAPMIHVRIPLYRLFLKSYISPFGALKLPAMVIAQPGGPFFALELPVTWEQVVHFADQSLASFAQSLPTAESIATDLGP